MHQLMAATMEQVIEDIRQIQKNARDKNDTTRRRWPMIVLRSPKVDRPEICRWPTNRGHFPIAPGAAAVDPEHPDHVKLLEPG